MQGLQEEPQDVAESSDAHKPAQSCEPLGHMPVHDAACAMHAPAHAFCPEGQLAPHAVPSQLALPPVGPTQAVQAAPQ